MHRRIVIALAVGLLAGCGGPYTPPPAGTDHPANPEAAEAPRPTVPEMLGTTEGSATETTGGPPKEGGSTPKETEEVNP